MALPTNDHRVAKRRMSTSICMATHNGRRFLPGQLASIVEQSEKPDEIIIVDDASEDDTPDLIRAFGDPTVTLIEQHENRGVVRSFETALTRATGELVFLCDQDDIWRKDKVETFKELFLRDAKVTLALSDARVIDESGAEIRDSWIGPSGFHSGVVRNVVRNRYLGCAMAVRRSSLSQCLPFPAHIPMHDMWIGLINRIFGQVAFIPQPLFSWRRHEGTVTKGRHASVMQMLAWRYHLVSSLVNRAVAIRRGDSRAQSALG